LPGDRLLRILSRLSAGDGTEPDAPRLCEVAADVTGMSGAGIMLMADDVPAGSLCSSNAVSDLIEELQYTLGEGPCVDAYGQGRPVLEPDLRDPVTPRWLGFTAPAVEAGARAAFGFPLQVGSVRLGALNLYRDRPGPLSEDQYADALVLAGVAGRAVLAMQAQAPPGMLAAELDEGGNFRFVVHQAAGMVSVQLGITVGEALLRLRAYAFGNDRLLAEVAEAVVARTLRFDDQAPAAEPQP
jgi:GAF domain-containing protein